MLVKKIISGKLRPGARNKGKDAGVVLQIGAHRHACAIDHVIAALALPDGEWLPLGDFDLQRVGKDQANAGLLHPIDVLKQISRLLGVESEKRTAGLDAYGRQNSLGCPPLQPRDTDRLRGMAEDRRNASEERVVGTIDRIQMQ